MLAHTIEGILSATGILGGYLSLVAILNLNKYSNVSEKGAKFSSTVKGQLVETRKTQALGALTVS